MFSVVSWVGLVELGFGMGCVFGGWRGDLNYLARAHRVSIQFHTNNIPTIQIHTISIQFYTISYNLYHSQIWVLDCFGEKEVE